MAAHSTHLTRFSRMSCFVVSVQRIVTIVSSMNDSVLQKLNTLISPCELCPRGCSAKRREGEFGTCKVGAMVRIASFGPHFGEEAELVGSGGSGTVFFSGCNLRCVFCQNADISFGLSGYDVSIEQLANIMLHLEKTGCENINLVTPTHFVPMIASAISYARGNGLKLPIVYNCGGYENGEVLRLLDGFIQIYMPDIKSLNSDWCRQHLNAPDYPDVVRKAIKIMYKQTGKLVVQDGVATRGVLIRHLVMPNAIKDSFAVLEFIVNEAPDALVNVMGQYRPCHDSMQYSTISRRTTSHETEQVKMRARELGLRLAR